MSRIIEEFAAKDSTPRDENITFRILSAIGIICVVMNHEHCTVLEFDSWLPYSSFVMSLFAFISGYFYSKRHDHTPIRFIGKKARTILIPFYLASLVYLLIQTLINHYIFSIGENFSFYNWIVKPWVECQPLGFNIATWFMIALFMAEVEYVLIRKVATLIKTDKIRDLIILLVTGTIAVIVINHSPYDIEWQKVWLRPFIMLLFLHIGFCYNNYIQGKINIPTVVLFAVLIVIRAILTSLYGGCVSGLFQCTFEAPWWAVFVATAVGIAFWLRIAILISPIVKTNGVLVEIGRRTREIMTHHLFAIFIWNGFVYCFLRLFSIESSFNTAEYKSAIYFRYIPWEGYALITTLAGIGIVVATVYFKDRIIKVVKQRLVTDAQ